MIDSGSPAPRRRPLTEAGSIIGTAQFLSPEQARGARSTVRPLLDRVVLYELLTGTIPFNGRRRSIAIKHLSQLPAPPSTHQPIPTRPRLRRATHARQGSTDRSTRPRNRLHLKTDRAQDQRLPAETTEAATTVLARRTSARRRRPPGPRPTRPAAATSIDEPRAAERSRPHSSARCSSCSRSSATNRLADRVAARRGEAGRVPTSPAASSASPSSTIRTRPQGAGQRTPTTKAYEAGIVFERTRGRRPDQRGNFVTMVVSTGPWKMRIPSVVSQSHDQAVSKLTTAGEDRTSSASTRSSRRHRAHDRPKDGTKVIVRTYGPRQRIRRGRSRSRPERDSEPDSKPPSRPPRRGFSRLPHDVQDSDQPRGSSSARMPPPARRHRRAP